MICKLFLVLIISSAANSGLLPFDGTSNVNLNNPFSNVLAGGNHLLDPLGLFSTKLPDPFGSSSSSSGVSSTPSNEGLNYEKSADESETTTTMLDSSNSSAVFVNNETMALRSSLDTLNASNILDLDLNGTTLGNYEKASSEFETTTAVPTGLIGDVASNDRSDLDSVLSNITGAADSILSNSTKAVEAKGGGIVGFLGSEAYAPFTNHKIHAKSSVSEITGNVLDFLGISDHKSGGHNGSSSSDVVPDSIVMIGEDELVGFLNRTGADDIAKKWQKFVAESGILSSNPNEEVGVMVISGWSSAQPISSVKLLKAFLIPSTHVDFSDTSSGSVAEYLKSLLSGGTGSGEDATESTTQAVDVKVTTAEVVGNDNPEASSEVSVETKLEETATPEKEEVSDAVTEMFTTPL